MKAITAKEAYHKINKIIDSFIELTHAYKDKPVQMYTTIENIEFSEFIKLYYLLNTSKKRLLLPEEMDSDFMFMLYKPVPGCAIAFESEKCAKIFPSLNTKEEPFIELNFRKFKNRFCMN